MIRKEDIEIQMNRYVGVWCKQDGTSSDAIATITTACKNKGINNLNIDMRKEINEQVLKVRGREIRFFEIHVKNEESVVKEICIGILDMNLPCYRGDVIMSLPNESLIFKTFVVLMVPSGNSERRGNGIHVVRYFTDEQCNLVFPTGAFASNKEKAFFKDIGMQLPTNLAGIDEKLKAAMTRQFGGYQTQHALEYAKLQLSYIARASMIYPSRMIWTDGTVPKMVRDIIPSINFTKDGALSHMEMDDVDRLGLLEYMTEVNEQNVINQEVGEDPNFVDMIGDAMRPRSNEERAKALIAVEKQIATSKYRKENIEVTQISPDAVVFRLRPRDRERPSDPSPPSEEREPPEREMNPGLQRRPVHRKTE